MPFAPGTRPKLTVPSARRGVGTDASALPRPRPCPCAWSEKKIVETATASVSVVNRRRKFIDGLRVGRVLARRGEQPLAARERDRACVADVAAILGRAALDRDLVADLHRVAGPALT